MSDKKNEIFLSQQVSSTPPLPMPLTIANITPKILMQIKKAGKEGDGKIFSGLLQELLNDNIPISELIKIDTGDKKNNCLHLVVWYGAADLVRRFLDMANAQNSLSITIDLKNELGCTALHLAAIQGRKEITMLLLNMGADISLRSNKKKTPLYYACERKRTGSDERNNLVGDIVNYLQSKQYQKLKELIDPSDKSTSSPLIYVVENEMLYMLESFIRTNLFTRDRLRRLADSKGCPSEPRKRIEKYLDELSKQPLNLVINASSSVVASNGHVSGVVNSPIVTGVELNIEHAHFTGHNPLAAPGSIAPQAALFSLTPPGQNKPSALAPNKIPNPKVIN
jgi:ankyrin repeat protein